MPATPSVDLPPPAMLRPAEATLETTAEATAEARTEMTAVEKVFTLPELFEMILLQLPNLNETGDFAVLFPLQRVSRDFFQMINASRQLLHVMYLRNIHGPSSGYIRGPDRLTWFLRSFLGIDADIRAADCRVRLPKLALEFETLLALNLDQIRSRNNISASWRHIGVAPVGCVTSLNIRLPVWITIRTPNSLLRLRRTYMRYSIYWTLDGNDTLGILYDRYLDVLTRTLEEHRAANHYYELHRQYWLLERDLRRNAGL